MNNRSSLDHVQTSLMWGLLGLSGWLLSFLLVLWLSSLVQYGYGGWYRVLGIDRHIAHYAAANVHKPGFHELSAEQHKHLFAGIVSAVHGRGETLENLSYPHRGQSIALLTVDEIGHLRDVQRLIQRAHWLFGLLLVMAAGLYVGCRQRPIARRRFLVANVALVAGLGILVGLLGPKAVFYQLHEWLFPPQYPWFFYWEESLMSTLMKAPHLFGAIAAQTLLLACPLWWLAMSLLLRHSGEGR